MEKTIHTAFLLCGLIGLLTGGICFSFAKGMLSLMNTKPELIDCAVLYLKIYAVGMPAMGIYNFGNGVMSASGDTRHPLMYLAFAGVINVILNLFFVIECHMAAEGVVPTVIVILGSCVFRIAWIYTVFAYFHTIPSLYLLYFFSWTITSVAEILYFVHTWRKMVREGQL